MNEKGKLTLPHVFWAAFPYQTAAYEALENVGLVFTHGNYDEVWAQLAAKYDAEALGRAVAACIRRRIAPNALDDIRRWYWDGIVPELSRIERADPIGHRAWIESETRDGGTIWLEFAKGWTPFGRFYFQHLESDPPEGHKRPLEEL